MTIAPDVGVPASAARDGAPHLSLVPPAPPTVAPFDLDAALGRAALRLHRYAVRRLGDSHEAEEVVQEALLRAYQHRATFVTEDDLMAWSTVVTGRLVIDRLRVRGRSVTVAEVPEPPRTGRDTADVVVARDEARAALDALEALPGRQAAVLWSREVEGLSYDAIAARYDLSEATVRSLLHRARKSLRREYAARGGSLPVAGLAVLTPWVDHLRGLGRLRKAAKDAAKTVLGPAGVGATALVVAGVTVLSLGGGPWQTPKVTPSISVQHSAKDAPSADPGSPRRDARPTPATPRGATVVPVVPPAALSPLATRTRKLLATHACTGATDGVGSAGVNCRPARAPGVYIGPDLPANPLGWRSVGVGATVIDCSDVPQNSLVTCVPADDSNSGDSSGAPSVPPLPGTGAQR